MYECEVVYRYRNNIENGFRFDSLVMPKTGAHTASLRFFMYGLDLIVFNIYMFYSLLNILLGYRRFASVKVFVYFLAYRLFSFTMKRFKMMVNKGLHSFSLSYWKPPPAI
ncbi:MAG: hypothetical protein ACP6IP_05125 [Candidatus Njordarchaeia archaeon]